MNRKLIRGLFLSVHKFNDISKLKTAIYHNIKIQDSKEKADSLST